MNYIEFFEKEVPDWMRESNRMMQLVGFNTPAYWNWVVVSIGKVCEKYNNDTLVKNQFHIIWDFLDEKAREVQNTETC
ncbi:hypothetical protein [Streptococcus vestibularis]|jgi:hypothetical protein|uniref:Uncharacterized protein n=1 Tax=Siphoviridae sp. ctzXg6 TaxID=2826531 RepID=A0A8S5NC07_9CAUD|nr:hypothetical protein [Streptococcus vestibularis]DAD92373.1 MAG TPA: hypothetical protein [Siphoviridae sp. ctzXg6]DAO09552.1 MAG TPA: hypothetical protein [Caudoviricetes sp.]MDU3178774.1 hypothetical protein [Streptococcus vestibularis]DAR74759.1 MAG TPA: hypothetical protein [Caudoviricetes sp.]DAZ32999.1 MAG TPA: hypothetical protein [Caudoviricetes sp.]